MFDILRFITSSLLSNFLGWVTIGDYEYNRGKVIGRGGFGIVYEGRDRKNTSKKVAVKIIEVVKTSKIKREMKLLQKISRLKHENFVQLLYNEEQPSSITLVMEFCNEDLDKYLGRQKKLSEATAAIFLRQIVKGLKVLKAHKIMHRDLKPHNLLLAYQAENPEPDSIIVKIADFGLAKFQQDYLQQMTRCGTIVYMAPEALTSEHYSSKVDIWSTGAILHVMVFGSLPFKKWGQTKHRYKCPKGGSQPLRNLLCSMLEKKPSERIDLQSLASHPFIQTPKERQLIELKEKYLPGKMSRSEKRKLYRDAIPVQDIPTWHGTTSINPTIGKMFEIDTDLNKKVSIFHGDITRLEVDAIVNPSNPNLAKGTLDGANKAIHNAAGRLLQKEITGLIGEYYYGSAEVTAGYNLPAYYVIHTVGPNNRDGAALSTCYHSCLKKVHDYNIRTIAFPAIATGNFGFPLDEATKISLKSVREWLQTGNNKLKVDRVIFVCFTQLALEAYKKHMPAYFPRN